MTERHGTAGRVWTWRAEADYIGAIHDAEPVRLDSFATGLRSTRLTDAVHEADATGRRVAL